MCGIAGVYSLKINQNIPLLQPLIDSMTDLLQHRGPDSRGTWIDQNLKVALGHRRLAIRDLTSTGHQPMLSSCNRFIIIYNGEIYSQEEIKKELKDRGRSLRGSSDTEVILEACAEWGIETTVKKLIGMFAFALFDITKNCLYLARDRVGIKPLYWSALNGIFVFGSELKALRAANTWSPKLDRNALASFMRHNYIPAPHTIYEQVYKLEPGCILKISQKNPEPKIIHYWNLREIVEHNIHHPLALSENQIITELDHLLQDAVQRRLVADVPLGTLLSGGIDSSLVTALMVEQSQQQIKTFSIGFRENEYNEAPYAREIAKHLGTEHTELYIDSSHALGLIEKLPYYYDEPFADSSQLPTLAVCELTKKHVSVALSGDGGDELFAGYNRYTYGLDLWQQANRAPLPLRQLFAKSILTMSTRQLDLLTGWIPRHIRPPQLGNKMHKFAKGILSQDPDAMYRQMLSHWNEPNQIINQSQETKGILWDTTIKKSIPNFLDRMQFLDTVTYLPDDILTKVDRASMSIGLEMRVPLLDHRVIEFAWRMPQTMKLRNRESKWILRQLLHKRVPRQLVDRPKMGFGVPLEHWLRGPLRDWAENLLSENRLQSQGLFAVAPIRERWKAHQNGDNWCYSLWNVLMAQTWIDANPGVTW